MSFDKLSWWLLRVILWLQKKKDKRRQLTDEESEALVSYVTKAMNIFESLGIDVASKPKDVGRRYHMMLLYLDHSEVICPAAARTASLIGFLDTLGSGWVLPPTSAVVPREFVEEVDGYIAVELLRNNLGLQDIYDEIGNALKVHQRLNAAAVDDEAKPAPAHWI